MKPRCSGLWAVVFFLSVLPLGSSSATAREKSAAASPPPGADLLAPLARLVGGQWHGQFKKPDGTTFHSRNIFEWGLDRKIIKFRAYALVAGAERLVYEGIYTWHPGKNKIVFRESSVGGSVNEGIVEPVEDTLQFAWTEYAGDESVRYREAFRFPDNDHYLSEAYQETADGWEKVIESTFTREASTDQAPGQRILRKEVVVAALLAEVWEAWTTTEGVKSFFGPGAKVEATPGGPFEIYFSLNAPEGLRGSEGCKVHSVVPMELFAFEWNQPPSIPALRGVHTVVFLRFEELGPGQTRVALTHTGWGVGEDWDKAYAYFDRAWNAVLGNLRYRFSVGPVDWPDGNFRAAQVDTKD